jgi:hypothetical protein
METNDNNLTAAEILKMKRESLIRNGKRTPVNGTLNPNAGVASKTPQEHSNW